MPSAYWQHKAQVGVDDMVLLSRIREDAIVDNLKKRYYANCIYVRMNSQEASSKNILQTYIGPVLVAVNPFKNINIYTERHIEEYRGGQLYENAPHIYALSDAMYRDMLIERDSQCVIISGESGAGKTVSAKHIMAYVSRVSGGGQRVQHVKDVILETNPLLEAFGNAKTILFASGEPVGGKVSNFLLEKSRVVKQNVDERNFHIFYQLCAGATPQMRETLGIAEPEYYYYLQQSGCAKLDDTDDLNDFQDTLHAMEVIGIPEGVQLDVLRLVAAILHIGNISFEERSDNFAKIANADFLNFPAYLLGIDAQMIGEKLIARTMEGKWGKQTESIEVSLNPIQAANARDALAKALYARLFDYLVKSVNNAMHVGNMRDLLTIGILDIYGFEIFEQNGFEQFCINYVNEKLQQIFIELTLKAEQEEYVSEGIHWTPIDYFNNKIVCELIEAKVQPPGIFSILDDTCARMHAVTSNADNTFLQNVSKVHAQHEHYEPAAQSFIVHHYAGKVQYDIEGFCERNRDELFSDLIQLMQSSNNAFIQSLFPETIQSGAKSRPTTAGTKIKTQANKLVESLMKCTPHYIRCIKPNETKRAGDWEDRRVKHQVEYLGLAENIRVRRAGYAYRRPFDKFLQRYAILTRETWPAWRGRSEDGIHHIMRYVNMDPDQYQLGRTKIFVKKPESLFLLEERRERAFDRFARIIQKAFRRFNARRQLERTKQEAIDLYKDRKERRRYSINRHYVGDYIGLDQDTGAGVQACVGRRERAYFAHTVTKYDRRWKEQSRDVVITGKALFIIGREKVEKGQPNAGQIVEVVKRRIEFDKIQKVGVSPYQDDFVVLYVQDDYATVFTTVFKTELLTVLHKRMMERINKALPLEVSQSFTFTLKKARFIGGGQRTIEFTRSANQAQNQSVVCETLPKGKILKVTTYAGLPANTRPQQSSTHRSYRSAPGRPKQQPAVVRHAPAIPTHGAHADAARLSTRLKRQSTERSQHAPSLPAHGNQVHPVRVMPSNVAQSRDILNQIPTGRAQQKRESIVKSASKPLPGGGRPKPKRVVPQCKALYDYQAADTDELSLRVGDVVELLSKDASGWWCGRLNGQEGLFPGNYVQEI